MTSAVQDFRVDLSTRLSALSGVTVAMKMQITNKRIHFAKKKPRPRSKGVGSAILHTARQATHSDQGFIQILLTQSPRMTRAYI